MRRPDRYSENLFTTVQLEDFVPADHPLRAIRTWVNEALVKMSSSFDAVYATDAGGGRPSNASEKLVRAMLLQVFFSVRSEGQLVEQIQYNLLFLWFVGLSIDGTVWNHSVFNKNRERLIKVDVVTTLFNATVEMAQQRWLLSGEYFSVDGSLIQAWASQKRVRRTDDRDGNKPPEDFRGEKRSNKTHASTSDPDSQLYRKSNAAPALPSYLGHLLTDNRHGFAVNVQVSQANSRGEGEVAVGMLADSAGGRRVTVGADKAYDTRDFISQCREQGVTPHVAQNLNRSGGSAIDGRTTPRPGHEASQQRRKCIEQCFG